MANYDSGSINKDYDCYSSVSLRLEKRIAFGERIIFPETERKLCARDAERVMGFVMRSGTGAGIRE